jgi:chemotaxis protein CheX
MQAKFINPFLNASMNLFKEFLDLEVKGGKPYLNPNSSKLEEISAIIGLAGDTTGAVVLSFSKETALSIVSRFAKKIYKDVDAEVLNTVGELTNIIAGNAKRELEDYRINISLPGVIVGHKYEINWPKGVPVITIPFTSEFGDFTVNVSMKE